MAVGGRVVSPGAPRARRAGVCSWEALPSRPTTQGAPSGGCGGGSGAPKQPSRGDCLQPLHPAARPPPSLPAFLGPGRWSHPWLCAEQNSRGSCPVLVGGGHPRPPHFWGRVLGRERVCVIGGQSVQGGWPLKGLVVEILLTGTAGLTAQVTLSGLGGRAPSPCVDPRLSQESAAPFPAASPPPRCAASVCLLSRSRSSK